MVGGHWLITSLSFTFMPSDGGDPTLLSDEAYGRKAGFAEAITCTVDFPEEGGIVRAVATVVPVPPK
jgi:hypothetical protein